MMVSTMLVEITSFGQEKNDKYLVIPRSSQIWTNLMKPIKSDLTTTLGHTMNTVKKKLDVY